VIFDGQAETVTQVDAADAAQGPQQAV